MANAQGATATNSAMTCPGSRRPACAAAFSARARTAGSIAEVPWRDATNEERLDGENGLLLTHSIDHLFDRGFIGFENNGRLIISPVAHRPSLQRMGIEVTEPINVGQFYKRTEEVLGFPSAVDLVAVYPNLALEREHWRSYTEADIVEGARVPIAKSERHAAFGWKPDILASRDRQFLLLGLCRCCLAPGQSSARTYWHY